MQRGVLLLVDMVYRVSSVTGQNKLTCDWSK